VLSTLLAFFARARLSGDQIGLGFRQKTIDCDAGEGRVNSGSGTTANEQTENHDDLKKVFGARFVNVGVFNCLGDAAKWRGVLVGRTQILGLSLGLAFLGRHLLSGHARESSPFRSINTMFNALSPRCMQNY
jgi:hypothetical protein